MRVVSAQLRRCCRPWHAVRVRAGTVFRRSLLGLGGLGSGGRSLADRAGRCVRLRLRRSREVPLLRRCRQYGSAPLRAPAQLRSPACPAEVTGCHRATRAVGSPGTGRRNRCRALAGRAHAVGRFARETGIYGFGGIRMAGARGLRIAVSADRSAGRRGGIQPVGGTSRILGSGGFRGPTANDRPDGSVRGRGFLRESFPRMLQRYV